MSNPPKRLDPATPIPGLPDTALVDFWSWAFSNVLSNAERGVFAEFIVGATLGVTDSPRREWDLVDLRYRGKKIEVKSGAYCQSWSQTAPSKIIFNIRESRGWDHDTNTWIESPTRSADCYVFCVFTEQDRANAHLRVIDLGAWEFYVLPTTQINQAFGKQKTVGLNPIKNLCPPVEHAQLKNTIDAALGFSRE